MTRTDMTVIYIDIVVDCSASMGNLLTWAEALFVNLHHDYDQYDGRYYIVEYGLTFFLAEKSKIITFGGNRFTKNPRHISNSLKAIKASGGAADGRENGVKAIKMSAEKLAGYAGQNTQTVMIFISDCYQFTSSAEAIDYVPDFIFMLVHDDNPCNKSKLIRQWLDRYQETGRDMDIIPLSRVLNTSTKAYRSLVNDTLYRRVRNTFATTSRIQRDKDTESAGRL
jgi:hypothetical protein